MGNTTSISCPHHGEKYVDFCIRTKWPESYPTTHRDILKLQIGKEGTIYCFIAPELNPKQRYFLNTIAMQNYCYHFGDCDFYRDTYYFCYMTDEVRKEFDIVDLEARNNLFANAKFNDAECLNFGYGTGYINNHYRQMLTDYKDSQSKWYQIYAEIGRLDKPRQEFLHKLRILGFFTIVTGEKFIYATKEQMQKFANGNNSHSDPKDIENQMLAILRAE